MIEEYKGWREFTSVVLVLFKLEALKLSTKSEHHINFQDYLEFKRRLKCRPQK